MSETYGWTCIDCGLWVNGNQEHKCNGESFKMICEICKHEKTKHGGIPCCNCKHFVRMDLWQPKQDKSDTP